MDKPTKTVVVGAALAALISVGAIIQDAANERALKAAVERCRAEAATSLKGPWLNYQKAALVCDPAALRQIGVGELTGTQKEVALASIEADSGSGELITIAIGVLFLFCIPWLWYFLLRRLREVASAIRNSD